MNTTRQTARNPWVAVALALMATGLGQVYCGRIARGLVLFLASLLFAPIIVVAAFLPPSTTVLVGMFLALGTVLALDLFAIVNAFLLARRMKEPYELKEYNRPIVYVLFILVGLSYPAGALLGIRANVFEAFSIPTRSEVPNLLPGDRVLVNKSTFQKRFPSRGDQVVFRVPHEPGRNWVKRIIALPGDKVEVRGNDVIINGQKLPRDREPAASLGPIAQEFKGEYFTETNAGSRYRILLAADAEPPQDYPETKVPEGTVFLLGDNRHHSQDSRSFGFVSLGEILGDVQYIYLPALAWDRFGAQ